MKTYCRGTSVALDSAKQLRYDLTYTNTFFLFYQWTVVTDGCGWICPVFQRSDVRMLTVDLPEGAPQHET